jgi:carbonic anhydrase
MPDLTHLLESNRAWAAAVKAQDPEFFARLAQQQAPKYLWIGCSDSRVPANQITGLAPGEVFVHRNIANIVVHTDLNCLSVMEFAVDVLRVGHIIVCGHYGCSGVRVAMERRRVGLADNWLRHVQDVHVKYATLLHRMPRDTRHDRLCELNVLEQALNVCQTTVVQDAWARGQPLAVHSWVYDLGDGLLRDLGLTVDRDSELNERYQQALDGLGM